MLIRFRIRCLRYALVLVSALTLASCADNAGEGNLMLDSELEQLLEAASGGLGKEFFLLPSGEDLSSIPQDPDNPLTLEKVALGKILFHETGLARQPRLTQGMNSYSCATCHHAPGGFQAGTQQGIGEGGAGFGLNGEARIIANGYSPEWIDIQPIRTPSAMNVAFQEVMLWNGQFGAKGMNKGTEGQWEAGTPVETNHLGFSGVETQAIASMKVHRLVLNKTIADELGYIDMFDRAFPGYPEGERYSNVTAGLAMAAYERTLLANQAPFQKWLRGDIDAMTSAEKRGAILFFGKANCVSCHTGPALNSMSFYALGMPDMDGSGIYGTGTPDAQKARLGRGGFTGHSQDYYKFKTPQLYNLTNSPFYGHGGNFKKLSELLAYKNAGIPANPEVPSDQLAEEFRPLGLTQEEIVDIELFLAGALKDNNLQRYVPVRLPSGQCFPNNDPQSRFDLGCD